MIRKQLGLAVTLIALCAYPLHGATLVFYDLNGAAGNEVSLNPTTVAAGLTGVGLTRGAGINPANLANGFSSNTWDLANPGSAAAAIAGDEYFQWGVTVDPLNVASLSSMDFTLRRSAAVGPRSYELQASLDGFATAGTVVSDFQYLGRTSGTAPGTVTPYQWMTVDTPGQPDGNLIAPIDLTATPILQSIPGGTTVTFRLFGWRDGSSGAADSNTIAMRFAGPKIEGSITAVPEPTTGALVLCLCMAVAAFRRTF